MTTFTSPGPSASFWWAPKFAEQHVYRRAAKLYEAAFKLDPGKSGRTLAAWLRRATPMESETASVDGSVGSQPPKRAKKSHGSRVQAPPVA